MSHPDSPLVKAVLANAPGAFERLVREHQALCWHIIYRMVRHPEDARELCQETFLLVHRRLRQFRHESALKSWIGRIAYTVALRHMERKRIALFDPGQDEDASSPIDKLSDGFDLETAYADSEIAARLHQVIETLPPLQRTLLTLYHLDELSIDEIAVITGLASGTIKSHLFRTRLRLREQLEVFYGVAP
ncbi:RNA polymerase sigma factor [Dyella flagellata]|uniref:RNA polymerase sigma factor n=1 Tax=Dyella flagellata TaxID=1867833 RepID=A0ABQ5XED0_9GAMM|nr:sigma-70 family RNA polymerase sigma factor [Dyella flagellata]GLQ89652.1 RNA polymerase sigma factor [Dyella flagellata]